MADGIGEEAARAARMDNRIVREAEEEAARRA